MFGPFHHEPGELYRILDVLNERHGTRLQRVAVHDRRIKLDLAFVREHGAASGVEKRIILELADSGLDRVERAAAFLKDLPTRLEGNFEPAAVLGLECRRHL